MAIRQQVLRQLHRVLNNCMIPDIASVNIAMIQALNMLFTQHCRRVDPAGDCLVVPAFPASDFKSGDKYVDVVYANAFINDEFEITLSYPKTDILVARLKPRVAIPIVGFYVNIGWYHMLIARLNIYRDVTKRELWKSVLLLPSNIITASAGGFIVTLSEPIIVGPGGDIAIEAVIGSSYNREFVSNMRVTVAWLPPVVFTSKSLFLTSPVTESNTES